MTEPSSASFFNSWDTYRKVVAGDYMSHREIGAELNRLLRKRFEDQPVSFLDLGCGDAATLAPAMEGLTLDRYKGVDLSETALALAAENLKSLPCPVTLVNGDILTALADDVTFDVIYSSFVLHHLRTAEKAEFFRLAAQRLKKGGLLLLADVMREENESLEAYHEHYCDWLRRSFSALNEDEKDLICNHILKDDLPDPCSVLKAQAKVAGLTDAFPSTHFGWHRLLSFKGA
ncbi:MAG TPA: class I SAM-dependent methyltransferase [Methylocella sp.]|nr:class I SAM-dependent methyltransferase [Methylocella sp.]